MPSEFRSFGALGKDTKRRNMDGSMKHEQIEIREELTATILSLEGQFVGGDETDALRDVLRDISTRKTADIIVDLTNVSYVNSSFISALLAAHASIARKGGTISVCGLNETIANIFAVSKLNLIFAISGDVSSALADRLSKQ